MYYDTSHAFYVYSTSPLSEALAGIVPRSDLAFDLQGHHLIVLVHCPGLVKGLWQGRFGPVRARFGRTWLQKDV